MPRIVLREIPGMKESLGVNIKLALPPALSKIERGFSHDRGDVRHLIERDLVDPARLRVVRCDRA